MANAVPIPNPLFDTEEHFLETGKEIIKGLTQTNAAEEYTYCLEFLRSYAKSPDTFTAYRRETERLLQWTWLIANKSIKELTRNDIRDYLNFVNLPPKTWIATKSVSRFVHYEGRRIANTEWRPFMMRVSKIARLHGTKTNVANYQLSNKSIEAIFAGLSSLFTFLQQEDYLDVNPVSLIRQKKGFIQRQQTRKVTRKLSKLQWHTVISAAEEMAEADPLHERTLFLMSAFYLLGVRISELAYGNGERIATMGSFAPDKSGLWWFTTVGKGNKIRDIAVPNELLEALKHYRTCLDLPPLPRREEPTPLFPKQKGKNGVGARQIRNLVQTVFDRAISQLHAQGKLDEAEDLATATVHWLRHTAISNEVEYRPREHIRDDVGHENPGTMDKYIDTDRVARHRSAQDKKLKPEMES